MSEIMVKSSKRDNAEIGVECPEVLKSPDLATLIDQIGDSMVFQKAMAQILIDFRSLVRGKMESQTDDSWNYTMDEIQSESYADWVPTQRVRKSKEEKAGEILEGLTPDQIKAALAKAGIDISKL
jgi:hypothetical protein